MQEIDSKFDLFISIVDGLSKHLFPNGKIRNEASDIEIADKLLNNPDISLFLKEEFVKEMRERLALKARGVIKQSQVEREILSKFAK
jgi:hypothetical protein